MASVKPATCLICSIEYDSAEHLCFELPCHHSFCLSCLLKLQKAESKNCPTCTKSFADINIESNIKIDFPAVETTANDDVAKCVKKKEMSICRRHNLSYSFWCKDCSVFCCNKCIISSHKPCESCIVEEATDVIKAGLLENIEVVKHQIDANVEDVNKCIEEAEKKLSIVQKFRVSVNAVEESMISYL